MEQCTQLNTCLTPAICRIPNAHKRLEAVHRAWHEAQTNYQDADTFTIAINNAIQGLRNVTFALQSALRNKTQGFDEWYATWQSILRADEVSKWSVEARNFITKVGDLNAKSSVRIWELRTYDDVSEFRAQKMLHKQPDRHARVPILSSRTIYQEIAEHDRPDQNPLQAIGIERRWEVEPLADWELLDAISHCFTLLCRVVLDAEITLIPSAVGVAPIPLPARDTDALSRPQCMRPKETDRLTIVSAEDGVPRIQVRHKVERDEEIIAQLPARYGDIPMFPRNFQSPLDLVDTYMKVAKKLLATDGEHIRIAYYFKGNRVVHGETPVLSGRTDKYLHALNQAELVAELGADGFLEVAEAWHLENLESLSPDMPGIAEHPERKEILIVTACTANRCSLSKMTPFSHSAFGILFGETVTTEYTPNYLKPMLQVWDEMYPG